MYPFCPHFVPRRKSLARWQSRSACRFVGLIFAAAAAHLHCQDPHGTAPQATCTALFTNFRQFYRVPDAPPAPGGCDDCQGQKLLELPFAARIRDSAGRERGGGGCPAFRSSSALPGFPLDSTHRRPACRAPLDGAPAVTTSEVTAANAVTT
jgi:hypothetical protein